MLPRRCYFVLLQGGGKARIYAALMPDPSKEMHGDKAGNSLTDLVAVHLPAELFDRACPAGHQGVLNNADVSPEALTAERLAPAGDAAGTKDRSVGHGISLALRGARELRDAVHRYGLKQQAPGEYAAERERYSGTLRQHAKWIAVHSVEDGPNSDARRARHFSETMAQTLGLSSNRGIRSRCPTWIAQE